MKMVLRMKKIYEKSVINLTQSRSEGRSKGRAAAGTHGGEKVAVGIDCKNGCRRGRRQDCNIR